MNAQKFLSRAQWLDTRVESRREQIERLRALAERTTSAYGDKAGGGSSTQDRRADIVAKLVDEERRLEEDISRLVDAKREIEAVIAMVPEEKMRALLEMRYINTLKWRAVARKMNYSEANVKRMHSAALRTVGRILGDMQNNHSESES